MTWTRFENQAQLKSDFGAGKYRLMNMKDYTIVEEEFGNYPPRYDRVPLMAEMLTMPRGMRGKEYDRN